MGGKGWSSLSFSLSPWCCFLGNGLPCRACSHLQMGLAAHQQVISLWGSWRQAGTSKQKPTTENKTTPPQLKASSFTHQGRPAGRLLLQNLLPYGVLPSVELNENLSSLLEPPGSVLRVVESSAKQSTLLMVLLCLLTFFLSFFLFFFFFFFSSLSHPPPPCIFIFFSLVGNQMKKQTKQNKTKQKTKPPPKLQPTTHNPHPTKHKQQQRELDESCCQASKRLG